MKPRFAPGLQDWSQNWANDFSNLTADTKGTDFFHWAWVKSADAAAHASSIDSAADTIANPVIEFATAQNDGNGDVTLLSQSDYHDDYHHDVHAVDAAPATPEGAGAISVISSTAMTSVLAASSVADSLTSPVALLGPQPSFSVGAVFTPPALADNQPFVTILHPLLATQGDVSVHAGPTVDLIQASITEASVGSGGATAGQVQEALDESGLSVNGSGIKVGVLSDSFNDLGGAAADEADGALPSASNVQILSDLSSGGTDEGRAMMQIVHDVAPGSSLAFYTAANSEQDFANGILALANAGCKVICDDVSYFDEPFFQNGIVAQAIQTVEAEGVTYVTSAGNNASNAYQAAWTPGSGLFDGVSFTDAELFGGSLANLVHQFGATERLSAEELESLNTLVKKIEAGDA